MRYDPPAPPAPMSRFVICLQPLGRGWSAQDTRGVAEAIEQTYGFAVRLLPGIDLPKDAYYPPRKRYRADRLLHDLCSLLPGDGFRIVGMTRADISTSMGSVKDWGVLGLASYDSPVAVISSYRVHPGSSSPSRTGSRLAKVAVHEIGHTLGLAHCPSAACIMQDAQGRAGHLDHVCGFCNECRLQLRREGYTLCSPADLTAQAMSASGGTIPPASP